MTNGTRSWVVMIKHAVLIGENLFSFLAKSLSLWATVVVARLVSWSFIRKVLFQRYSNVGKEKVTTVPFIHSNNHSFTAHFSDMSPLCLKTTLPMSNWTMAKLWSLRYGIRRDKRTMIDSDHCRIPRRT